MKAKMRKPPNIAEVRLDGEPVIIRIPLGTCLISSNGNVEKRNTVDINEGNLCSHLDREEYNAKM